MNIPDNQQHQKSKTYSKETVKNYKIKKTFYFCFLIYIFYKIYGYSICQMPGKETFFIKKKKMNKKTYIYIKTKLFVHDFSENNNRKKFIKKKIYKK